MEFRPMSPEEIERTVQFLLHQQAQFAADFEKLSVKTDHLADGLIGLSVKTDHLADGLINLSVKTDHLADGLINLSVKTDHLADGLIGLTSIVGRVTDSLGQLAAGQQRTDQQLRDVIRMFERHLREDHGRPPS